MLTTQKVLLQNLNIRKLVKIIFCFTAFLKRSRDKNLQDWVVPEKFHIPLTDGILGILAGGGGGVKEIPGGRKHVSPLCLEKE